MFQNVYQQYQVPDSNFQEPFHLNVTHERNWGNNFLKQLVWYNSKNKGTTGKRWCKRLAFQNYLPWESMVRCLAENGTNRIFKMSHGSIFTYSSVILLSFSWININIWHIKITLEETHLWIQIRIFLNKIQTNWIQECVTELVLNQDYKS